MAQSVEEKLGLKRSRKRIDSLKIDRDTIADRVKRFYDKDHEERTGEIEARLQRYAKFRMWTEGKDWPWPGATDAAIPDMMTASMRLQDTLHNAVLAQRPCIMAKAVQKTFAEREEKLTFLLDYQFFEEQPGEDIIGQLADDFVNEGFYTVYTPWIDEKRRVKEVRIYDAIPEEQAPIEFFLGILQGFYPRAELTPDGAGWDWRIKDGEKHFRASFYSKDDDRIELELEREAQMFNGPRAIRKDLQDVLHPPRCENLQIKSPSNPNGASHVILRDFPSIDEIKRLVDEGYYDLITKEQKEKLGLLRMDTSYQEREEQKDIMQGSAEQSEVPTGAESHKPITRLMCFDCYDIDGDGLDEDVVFWMLLEDKIVLKAKYLSEIFPSDPPRRPFGEAQLFPVPGRRYAIGLLEMMEGIHDLMKQFFDQGGDAGILANAPFGFYRASSNMRPEVMRMWPGEMAPLSDPQRDVFFPQLGNQSQAFTFNMIALLTQVEERLTTIGDLQVGRVPQGKASALRTVSGMQTILAQGDARPERVLRRFFMGLTQIWQNFHALNEILLPKRKQFKLCGAIDPRRDPFAEIASMDEVRGKYRFTFSANVLNTSKEAMQSALQTLMTAYVSPLAIQLGIAKPDGVYRLFRDFGRAFGQDPDKYISPPTPGAMEPPISAEDAILFIMDGVMPRGSPLEGAQAQFQKLQEFSASDDFGHLDGAQVPLFRAYLQSLAELMAQEQAQAALLAAAQQFQQGMSQPGKSGPQAMPQAGGRDMPMLQSGELADESLPGAGGGANPEMMA